MRLNDISAINHATLRRYIPLYQVQTALSLSYVTMAAPPGKRVVELIDLTLDDDDDEDNVNPPPQPHANGGIIAHNNHALPVTISQAPSFASDYFQDGPARKRVKLTDENSAQSIIFPYAQAGAKQAVTEEPRLIEAVVREKV